MPNVGAPDCIDIDEANEPRMTGAPGRTSWQKAIPASASASVCVAAPTTVAGLIAPARMNGVISTAWFASAYAFAAPSIVESQTIGEFALAERDDHRVRLEEVGAEEDPRHLDRVLAPARVRDRAHERLVRVAHVRVDHVVVPLVHGQVDGLADGAARVVQERASCR